MPSPAAEQRIAQFLSLVTSGLSQRCACSLARVSQKTVWLRRRSVPSFAAALTRACYEGERAAAQDDAKVRKQEFRRGWMELAFEADEREQRTPEHLRDRPRKDLTKKQKRFWLKHQGRWPGSEMPQGDDYPSVKARLDLRAKMQADFAARRAEKGLPPKPDPVRRQHEPAEPQPPSRIEPWQPTGPPRKTRGRSGPLW